MSIKLTGNAIADCMLDCIFSITICLRAGQRITLEFGSPAVLPWVPATQQISSNILTASTHGEHVVLHAAINPVCDKAMQGSCRFACYGTSQLWVLMQVQHC